MKTCLPLGVHCYFINCFRCEKPFYLVEVCLFLTAKLFCSLHHMPLWDYALQSGLNFGFSLEYFTRREILHTEMLSIEHSCKKKKEKKKSE